MDHFLDINESWCNENTRRSLPPRSQQIIKHNSLTCNTSKISSLVDLTIDNLDKDKSARMQQLDVILEDDKLVHSCSSNDRHDGHDDNVNNDADSQVSSMRLNESFCDENTPRSLPPRSQLVSQYDPLTTSTIVSKKSSLRGWFETNAIIKPKFDEAVVKKRLLEAEEKAISFDTKFSRMRKGSHDPDVHLLYNASPSSSSNSGRSLDGKFQTSDSSDNNTPNNSQDNFNLAISPEFSLTPFQSPSHERHTSMIKNGVAKVHNSIKPPSPILESIPSILTQRQRIRIVRVFDERNGSANFEVLKATKAGLHCEVCDCTLVDMSSVIRFDASGQVKRHCHIGSSNHIAGMYIILYIT